jgi:ankyrin repeat protein
MLADKPELLALVFIHVAKKNHIELVPVFDTLSFNPNKQASDLFNNTALHWAIANGNNEFAWIMLETFGEKLKDSMFYTNCSYSPLHLVLTKGYIDMDSEKRVFNKYYKDFSLKENDFSAVALAKKMITLFPGMIDLQTNNSPSGNTALHIAYARRDKDMISLLVNNKASSEIKNEKGQIPSELLALSYDAAEKFLSSITSSFILKKDKFDAYKLTNK